MSFGFLGFSFAFYLQEKKGMNNGSRNQKEGCLIITAGNAV